MNPVNKERVVAAMSGGVDSSVAAALLKRQGFDVIGITMKLWPKEECGFYRASACCSLEGIADARLVSEKINIPFYVLDFHAEFKKEVVDYFTSEYLKGRTPNPCILCNERIKFGILIKKAEELDAEYVATGHYAKIIFDKRKRRYLLKEGRDRNKDQSYLLFSLTQEQLSKIKLPIGNMRKPEVRRLARRLGLPVHNKKDSQEICFIRDSYVEYLKERFKDKIKPGPIVYEDGSVIGTHKGIPFYTIGQREGLGIAYRHALYVKKIDAGANRITVGPKESTYLNDMTVKEINWIAPQGGKRLRARVKIRSQHKKADALLTLHGGAASIKFDRPQESPTPGQAAVFYNRDIVIGGGWIAEAEETRNQ